MKKSLLAVLLAVTTSVSLAQTRATGARVAETRAAGGLAVSGTVSGSLPSQARVGGFLLDGSGAPVAEVVSVPVNGGRFSLELPNLTPGQRPLSPLRADTVFWPGVLEPVTVEGQASSADLRFYVYGDANGNGRRDDTEAMQEVVPFVGKAVLVVNFSTAAAQVNASRGFQASLKPGWNGLLIEVGKTVRVTSSSAVTGVSLNAQR